MELYFGLPLGTFEEGANMAYVSPWEEILETLDPVPLATKPSHGPLEPMR